MTSRKFIATLVVALLGLAALPSLASALTITVDDDRVQCPLADETSLTAAVAVAANGDTVKICAGTYNVPGGPAPSSGLKIEKNINLAGAGSDKVFIQPTQGSGSMAQATPNPRDEYGNVITVRRRLIELYDVSISGLTVRAGNVPVEAGIAMIDVVTGTISSVKVEGIVPTTGGNNPKPLPGTGAYAPEIESVPNPLSQYGNAVIVANTIEQTQNTTTITGSQFGSTTSGFNATGVLVDSRRLSGTEPVGNKSTVTANIVNTRINGAGGVQPIGQTGVEAWGSGATVKLTKSKIAEVGKADGSAAAVEMHGVDLVNSVIGGSEADRNDLTANAYGATNVAFDGSAAAASLKAGGNFWGTTTSAGVPLVGPNVDTEPTMPTAPAGPTLAPIADQLPIIEWEVKPVEGTVFAPGTSIPLAAVARDDFGVRTVEFRANGGTVSTAPTPPLLGERVYSGSWTPTAGYAGEVTISAVAVDANNLTSEVKVKVLVEGKPHFTAAPAITGFSGYASVGKPLTCSTGAAPAYPVPTYTYAWTVAGAPVGTDSPTYTPVAADQGKKVVCTVKATNSFGSATSASGQVPVAKEPTFASPATITGGNTGVYA
ncbi:MAG TPA: Ig-like domain-containing protein, partial [Solirubrobacterales bacterium]|nr:Ig-like domain-containing protein [Solirubrobacterales bacterium]